MENFDICKLLEENSYPGRGIILGRSSDNNSAVIAYWIMGRSENSRNRIFSKTDDGIRTEPFDASKMSDPSLIIYHPVRTLGDKTIVTNGDQTDTIRDFMVNGGSYIDALRTRTFEPDGPNYTPRISGVMNGDGSYVISILKSAAGDPSVTERFFFEYSAALSGRGHFISTYEGDGDPLPSFVGEPTPIDITENSAEGFGKVLWEKLNISNKVSLFVRYIDLKSGNTDTRVYNKNGESWSDKQTV